MKLNEKIDILKFFAEVNYKDWNQFLYHCYNRGDIFKLVAMRNGFQQGMNELVKKKLDCEKLTIFFIRIQRSIENTLKQIHRDKNPNPLYNPLHTDTRDKFLKDKKAQQHELEKFIRRHNY